MSQLYSPPALARALRVSDRSVYRWLRAGLIESPRSRVGATRAFDEEQVQSIRDWHEGRKADVRNRRINA